MALARNLFHRRLYSLLEPQNVAFVYHIIHSNPPHSHKIPPSSLHRPFASSSQSLAESDQTHAVKSLHSLFLGPLEQRSDRKNEKLEGKSRQGEAVGLSEKTGDKKNVVRCIEDKRKKPKKKSKKPGKWKGKLIEEEEEVVKEELQGEPEQVEAVSLSEKTEQEKNEVRCIEDKKKKPKKKLKKPGKWKVKFIEEEEEVVTEELQGKPDQGEAVTLSEKTEREKNEVRCIEEKKKKPKKKSKKPGKWKVKFIEEEEEEEEVVVEGEQTKKPEPKRLYDLFGQGKKSNEANPRRLSPGIAPVEKHKEVKQREPVGLKKLSLDMETFLSYLYKEGYFRDANFVKGKNFDLSWFDDIKYARYYTLSVVQKFGKDKQEISKWLSGSDLKQVAMFGCPSDSKSQVFPSKRLRYYFKIPENTVCSTCVLRDSCKFVNQSVWRTDNNNLDLAVAMKVVCSYALSIVHPQLVVPDKVNSSVNRLLKEVLKLSQTF
ncbi:hypothetical protein QN277_008857 [Acacia crassicarpa]|uniref:Uncharacterized protein n=1 Tax=Acacia crassicarpa TaxID=499986 RepID=A0AAE1IRW8_9FABA|nr:hypothetical protein QN277_008857 [Acacia crassicarpa]